MKKTMDCLQNARLFSMKRHIIIDTDFNVNWDSGYIPQFMMRCLYFDIATTWYSNTFDQLLQAVYWAYELYTSAVDRDGNSYNDTWDVKKTMTFCTYEFVVGELKNRGLSKVRKYLTSCSGNIETARCWANYIKHKGGVEYKYLEPKDPFKVYIQLNDEKQEKTEIENFKSTTEIDIDDDIQKLVDTHHALYKCICDVIDEIDYEQYNIKF